MSTDHHDPIANGAPANSSVINAPLAQLDQAIKDIDFTPSGNSDEFLNGNKEFTVPSGTGSTNGHVVQDESVDLAQKGKLDFQGASVKAQTGATATEVLINGAVLAKNTETLTGDITLTDTSAPVQFLDPGGADRVVKLPAGAATNPFFIFANMADAAEKLTIQNNAGTETIVEINQGELRIVFSDGTSAVANTAGSGGGGSTSPLTTKGDIWVFTTTDARFPVGSNGQVLTADSTQASGLKWETPSSNFSEDGWIAAGETWTYASATTFTVAGDKTGKYQPGDKIKLTQTSDKYFYIVNVSYSSPNTTITITGGSDYSLADVAITNPKFSKVSTPQGFPEWFNWTPSLTGFSSDPTDTIYIFRIMGKTCEVLFSQDTNGISNATNFLISAPVDCVQLTNYQPIGSALGVDNGATLSSPCFVYFNQTDRSNIKVGQGWMAALWTASGGKRAKGSINYKYA